MSISNIVIMGFGKMPKDCAEILLRNRINIKQILETEKNDLSPLKGYCSRVKIPFKHTNKKETTSFLDSIDEPTVVFSINNNYIFPNKIIEKKNLRIVNFHNSLLPKYPGHGQVIPSWVIFNGETRHGVTWHLIDKGIDSGNILCQKGFSISKKDIALQVMMRAIKLGIELFSLHWKEFIDPTNKGIPQKKHKRHIYRIKDIPNDGHVNISWDFVKMNNFLRSMDYGPFRLLPPSIIKLGKKAYEIKSYQIYPRKKQVTKYRMQLSPLNKAEKNEMIFFYKKGIIRLIVKEVAASGENN